MVTRDQHWDRSGSGLIPLRWVDVPDLSGTHREEYLFSTDVPLSVKEIVEAYTRRWNVETTFPEMRTWLKLEKRRGWSEKTVLRTAPCLFGLSSVIAVIYPDLPAKWQREGAIAWGQKTCVTFSDALTAVCRWLWAEWIFASLDHRRAFTKIPPRLRVALLTSLAPAP